MYFLNIGHLTIISEFMVSKKTYLKVFKLGNINNIQSDRWFSVLINSAILTLNIK